MKPPVPPNAGIQITVNGSEQVSLPASASVQDLVSHCRPRPPFAVEVNRRLVPHRRYADTPLADGDRVEIVELVGGG
jgi:sulfur carrier protein